MTLDPSVHSEISNTISSDDVVLFMKGRRTMPQCGFSATVVQILNQYLEKYTTVNVLSNPAIRDGIKEFSEWPTIPQLYIKGEFVGGCDIVQDLENQGQLAGLLGSKPSVEAPSITLTESAKTALDDAMEADEDKVIRIEISPDYRYNLGFDSAQEKDFKIESLDYTLLIDLASARRAENVVIDFQSNTDAAGFKITNDAEPPVVKPLTPQAVKAKRDANESFEFLDVRTPQEREIARIDSTKLLDQTAIEQISQMDKNTSLVFHCHHGARADQAAQHFIGLGFVNVYNMTGGIDAWAAEIDTSIPRY
jgi:monothiol glutaredoxin